MAGTGYDAIVIGAGHNGLISAGYLAKAGKRVLVLERRDIVGGACVTEEVWEGYRVSVGAYLCSLLLPEIIEDLELKKYGFEVYRRETSGFTPFLDGNYMHFYPDEEKMRAELTAFCAETPQDVDAYFAFEADVERVATVLDAVMMQEPPTESELRALFANAGIAHLFDDFMVGSVRNLLDKRFQNERLKAILSTDGLIGTYGGVSSQGTAYVLVHHYMGKVLGSRGSWGYVRGGMGNITQGLAQFMREQGGEIRLSASVKRLLLEEGRCVGVELESGEQILAPAVLSNADPYRTFVTLLGDDAPFKGQPGLWTDLKTKGGASAKINLAVSELPQFTCLPKREDKSVVGAEHLGTVHLCPDMDYLERAWHDAEQGYPSKEPMIEVYLQTATDATLTPPGKHILSLFVQYFPYNLAAGLDLDTEREAFADRVIEIVGRYAPNVPASILHRQVLTPRDLEARFGLTGGHIFHGDLLPPYLWRDKPGAGFTGAHTPIEGLYLCGSGAHPGGCVFGAPGYNAAQAVLNSK